MNRIALLVILLVWANACNSQPATRFADPNEVVATAADRARVAQLLTQLAPDRALPTGELAVKIGQQLLGLPYVAHTLETGPGEKLVVNLRELDCTTFDETCLALARTIREGGTSFADYTARLTQVRYRNGLRKGYLSRLHYFSDWLADNARRGLISPLDSSFQTAWQKRIDFMSTHPDSYEVLKANPQLVGELAGHEREISALRLFFLPKSDIQANEFRLKNGDLVAITTSIAGLDIVHVGMVIWVEGRVHLLHASSALNRVVVSDEPLADYLAGKKSFTGIMLARPN